MSEAIFLKSHQYDHKRELKRTTPIGMSSQWEKDHETSTLKKEL